MPRDLLRRALGRLRRVVGGPAASAPAAPPPLPRPVLGYVVAGGGGAHPASAHVRVVRRVEHLVASGRAEARQVDPEAFVAGTDDTPYASLLVQRDVLRGASSHRSWERPPDGGSPSSPRWTTTSSPPRPRRGSPARSTTRAPRVDRRPRPRRRPGGGQHDELAAVVRPVARRVEVVRNALDPAIWAADAPLAAEPDLATDEHRVLYMGTLTHAADLALLREVFDGLTAADGLPIRLEVIGVTEATESADWYRRVEVPDGHYPAFARWLVRARGRWSAGVAPLRDEEFNRAKSDLKAIEYVALDLPAVVSDRPSYAAAAAHGVTAVPDDPEAWRAALRTAVAQGAPAARAVDWVRSERLIGGPHDSWPDAVLG